MKNFLAVDIGGTYIKTAVIDEAGSIMKISKIKTPKSLAGLMDLIADLNQVHPGTQGIAVSCPGAVSEKGVVHGTSALPYLHGPNIKQMMAEHTGQQIFMENDANCAAYAELWKGKAKTKHDVLVIVIGTGIGGAIIKNGEVHKGANLHGGEFGYMLIPTHSENGFDTWSDTGATGALIRKVAWLKQRKADQLTGEEIFNLATAGDPVCKREVAAFYRYLALGIYNLQYIYDPELILIGGGISARPDLIQQINTSISEILRRLPGSTIKPVVDTCEFRQHANLLGAVYGLMQLEKEALH
ncbi:ROK family protein [Virgibacillus halophilus]|uniref:ROK family protein n=1 Tax=Tigheibacillus halophilus TaxID=361280 RepID=A0ABU5C3Q5_9BACI|nr:ROK family protein [Virgibacillus halophilus]